MNAGMSVEKSLQIAQRLDDPAPDDHIYTKVGNKLRKVKLDDILYIEVEGKYSALQVNDRKYNVKASLKDLSAETARQPVCAREPQLCGQSEAHPAH